jgi:hypothetical protein
VRQWPLADLLRDPDQIAVGILEEEFPLPALAVAMSTPDLSQR